MKAYRKAVMRKSTYVLLTLFALIAAVLSPVAAGASDTASLEVPQAFADALANEKSGVFIVMMDGEPAAAATSNGQGYNPNSGKSKRHQKQLTSAHEAAASSVGADPFYSYTHSFNGFAAVMTGADAAALMGREDVLMVWKDEIRQLQTDNSPDFLGLTESGGLWDMGYTGEDVIVGIIDTGIWPEHPSFSDQADNVDRPGKSGKRTLAYDSPPSDWYGSCQSGERFSQDDCNNKLIGARYFKDGFTNNGIKVSGDYLSARDADGHGSHTAATAAGNAGVEAEILGGDLGTVTGIAPRARIAAYKACWADAGCAGSDLVAAIDQAVADGVDVINYSIGSSATTLAADDISFLFAADAGVHVATSNGNAGPDASTVGSPAWTPWVTSVGASTQDRTFEGSAASTDGWEFFGASVTGDLAETKLVDAADAGDELCNPGALDPAVVAGNVVLCKRGAIARVAKSQAVELAGGVGTILYNASDAQSQVTDNHYTPAVHINNTDGVVIKAYIASAGESAKASINGGEFKTIDAPWMADFSSRGPNGGAADIIKPDVTAPGVNILAANTPTPFLGAPGQLFQAISGTSMSSPHVAGIFALLAEAHPTWSPSATKSAIMTTAYQEVKKENGSTPADPFDIGAGHVDPNPAADPGLVYQAGFNDYLAFLCGNNPESINPATCSALEGLGYSLDPSDLNYPSVGVGALAGSQIVVRTVTNVGPAGTYTASVSAPAGIDVVVTPDVLNLANGESASFEIELTSNSSVVVDTWAFGSLEWTDGTRSVRSPIAVQPVKLAAPSEAAGVGVDGSEQFSISFGYTGDYQAGAHGLVPAVMEDGNVVDDPANDINTALDTGVGITLHAVAVPAGTVHARFSLFDDYTDGDDDLDLYVFGPDTADFPFVGGSGSGTSEEQVDIRMPAEGLYLVVVHGWQTDGPDANYTLFSWNVGVADAGNMTVSGPGAAVLGTSETVDFSWTGLAEGTKYLGAISHADGPTVPDDIIDLTMVRVDTD